jgi:23S rRNA pseudouridine955/2504/2580 synthase/23S rRNA pseudouridine1911/1915/1917 synthase
VDKLYGPDERIYLKIRNQEISGAEKALLVMDRQALHNASLAF